MERLTVRNVKGIGVLKQPFECERCGDLQWSLPDLGNGSPIDKLSDYEDLEEQGKLLKLPCAVGDRLYQINADEPSDIQSYTIDNIIIREGKILFKYDSWDGVICDLDSLINGNKYLGCFRTFFTYEEAEATLNEKKK